MYNIFDVAQDYIQNEIDTKGFVNGEIEIDFTHICGFGEIVEALEEMKLDGEPTEDENIWIIYQN